MKTLKITMKLGLMWALALAVPVSSVAQVFDESFNATVGPVAGHRVESIALQSDGRILIGGLFAEVNGVARGGLARLNSNGSLDTTFSASFNPAYVGAIAVQSDGKILVGGQFPAITGLAATELARLNPNGSTDLTFNPRVAGPVHDVLVLADGDILVAGQFSSVNGVNLGTEGSLVRLNPDGTRDLSLRAVVHEAGTDFVRTMAVQADGKIVIGGSFVVSVNNMPSRRYFARLNANGSLDTHFPGASPFGAVQAIVVRPDGRILVGGTFDSLFDTPRQSHRGIVQLNGDGTLDTGFTPDFNVGNNIEAFALQPDGKVWAGGFFSSIEGRDARRIARLMPNGSLDLTFGPFPPVQSGVLAVVLQPDGKPIIGGNFFGVGIGHPDIARLLPITAAQMSLDKTSLRFGALTNGAAFVAQTPAQIVRLTQSGPGTVTWTAASNQPWLQISPASGTGGAALSIAVAFAPGLSGPVGGSITFTFTGVANNPGPIAVTLAVFQNGTSAMPFGTVDTPTDNRTGVTGAVPFTGWALDDIGISRIAICRLPFGAEVAPPNPNCGGAPDVFVGFAVAIEGARPDVAAAFPTHPANTIGGWGFMVLTNMLPNQGNGTYVFTIYAEDREGAWTLLGTRTMTCGNATATLPFGAIDTPAQGGVASGTSFINFGWALTPLPKTIPIDGSTITVMVDGISLGTVSYNHLRADIATLFPGYNNANGAIGFKVIDTTQLANGTHTIVWVVTDNAGASQGIGSRFFTVSNGVSAMTAGGVVAGAAMVPSPALVASLPIAEGVVWGRRGFDLEAPFDVYRSTTLRRVTLRGEEIDRFELALGERAGTQLTGYLRVGREISPLPIGSTLNPDTGTFTWTPGVGFVGNYDLVFVRWNGATPIERREVRIAVHPKGSGR